MAHTAPNPEGGHQKVALARAAIQGRRQECVGWPELDWSELRAAVAATTVTAATMQGTGEHAEGLGGIYCVPGARGAP